jgi:hypothetical protein
MSFQLSSRRNPAYALAGVLVCLVGCASAPDRPARSSVGCAEATLDQHLPSGLSDKRAHCIAGGLIARFCSPTEARLAGLGKEVRDAFGPGDADWSDWQATRAGVRCAAAAADVTSIITCCENAQPGTYKDGDPPP